MAGAGRGLHRGVLPAAYSAPVTVSGRKEWTRRAVRGVRRDASQEGGGKPNAGFAVPHEYRRWQSRFRYTCDHRPRRRPVLLADQDRTRWDHRRIAECVGLLADDHLAEVRRYVAEP
ncbi:hypothetical protein GCM10009838_12970 [Catenulispora subtropica]|uniref:Uncharacterized protein n=1 Tax=Catenulispora subtropica TaxID=450798 RepID=A0ABN2QUH4_9ACTN